MLNQLQLNHQRERDFALAEALRLANVRDELGSRYLFGLATFNAAAVVALLASLGSPHGVLSFGLDDATLKYAIGFFVVGVVFAGIAISATQNNLTVRAGVVAARVTILSILIDVSADHWADDGQYKVHSASRDSLFNESLKHSNVAIWFQNMSGGAWLAGAATPLVKLFGLTTMLSSWL